MENHGVKCSCYYLLIANFFYLWILIGKFSKSSSVSETTNIGYYIDAFSIEFYLKYRINSCLRDFYKPFYYLMKLSNVFMN